MKAQAILNNYQIGSYAFDCMKSKIIKKERIGVYHTLVVWDNLELNEFNLLKRIIHNIKEAV